MPIARVNTSAAFASGSDTTIASAATSLTTGNLIVVLVRAQDGDVSGVADTAGNTYRRVMRLQWQSTGFEMWYAVNVTGDASNVVTVTFGSSRANRGLLTAQYSGFTSAVQLQTATLKHLLTGGTSITSDPFNTQTDDALILQGCQINLTSTTWTPGSGFSSAVEDASTVQILAENIVSAAQALATAAMTNSASNASLMQIVAVFAEPAGGGPGGAGVSRARVQRAM